ncbi:MAG TPA: hypothetical protein VM737_06425 [Gemmatimonadota bacterium]|nr:hypothetical protein [Gemmatimonadota bacterium]
MQARHRRYGGTPRSNLGAYIAGRAPEWVKTWLRDVRRDETTPTYHTYADTAELLRDTEALYHYLAIWLRRGEWDPRIDPHYQRIGRDRRREGFPLSEVVSAILLAKRHLWDGLVEGNQLSIALELEVQKAMRLFYDRAIYNTVLGYESDEAG